MTTRPRSSGGAAALAFVVVSGGFCILFVRDPPNDIGLVRAPLIPMFVWSLAAPGIALSWVLPWMLPRFEPRRRWHLARIAIRVLTALVAPPVLLWALFYVKDGTPDPFATAIAYVNIWFSYLMELVTIPAFVKMVDEAIAAFLQIAEDQD